MAHGLQDILVCFLAATVLAYVAQWTRQPLVLAYIAAGVLLGPIGFKLVSDPDEVQQLSEMGLAFMLFIVGLEVDVTRLLSIGKRATPVTIVQVFGCAALGWLAAMALGYRGLESIYIAMAVSLSSTMIAVKMLSDRAELESGHGQMIMGVLLLQDLVAIAMLALQPSMGGGGDAAAGTTTQLPWVVAVLSLVKGAGLVAGAILLSRFALPLLFRFVSRSPEVMLLTALSWCFLICSAALRLDFSIAMGALIAGVSIAAFPYALDVIAKIRGLRTFFVTLFFVSLGMLLKMPPMHTVVIALVLSLVVIVSRFLTVWPTVKVCGYTPRMGVLSSIYLAQVSEFGVIVALVGSSAQYKHVSTDLVSLIVLVLIITSIASTYMIEYSHRLAGLLVPRATTTEADKSKSSVMVHDEAPAPVMLIGCFRVGSSLIHELRQAYIDFSVVDFSQHVNERLNKLGVKTVYGDISHMDTLEHAGADKAQILICSIADDFLRGTDNLRLLQTLRKLNPAAKIIVTSDSIEGATRLYTEGADYVVMPRVLVARHLMEVIAEIGAGELKERRDIEVEHLPQRVEVVR
ncbi:MAG: cation:proton antiporter [Planctomycetes bacterium]|nr:cation:proton antiporter [Planctomycetota bacterium]